MKKQSPVLENIKCYKKILRYAGENLSALFQALAESRKNDPEIRILEGRAESFDYVIKDSCDIAKFFVEMLEREQRAQERGSR